MQPLIVHFPTMFGFSFFIYKKMDKKETKKIIWSIIVILLFIVTLSYIANNIIFTEKPASLFDFALVNFGSYLFFLLMPTEILYSYYIISGYNALAMILTAVVTAALAQIIDYEIGKYFSSKVIDGFISRKKYNRYNHLIHRWGGPVIFLFCLSPLSSPILLLVAGIIKFGLKKSLIWSIPGLTIKYIFLALVF